jgi:hypothetical protein
MSETPSPMSIVSISSLRAGAMRPTTLPGTPTQTDPAWLQMYGVSRRSLTGEVTRSVEGSIR